MALLLSHPHTVPDTPQPQPAHTPQQGRTLLKSEAKAEGTSEKARTTPCGRAALYRRTANPSPLLSVTLRTVAGRGVPMRGVGLPGTAEAEADGQGDQSQHSSALPNHPRSATAEHLGGCRTPLFCTHCPSAPTCAR